MGIVLHQGNAWKQYVEESFKTPTDMKSPDYDLLLHATSKQLSQAMLTLITAEDTRL